MQYIVEEGDDEAFDSSGDTNLRVNVNSTLVERAPVSAVSVPKDYRDILPGDKTYAEDTYAIVRVCEEGVQRIHRYAHELHQILKSYRDLSSTLNLLLGVKRDHRGLTFVDHIQASLPKVQESIDNFAKEILLVGFRKHSVERDEIRPTKDAHMDQFVIDKIQGGIPKRRAKTMFVKGQVSAVASKALVRKYGQAMPADIKEKRKVERKRAKAAVDDLFQYDFHGVNGQHRGYATRVSRTSSEAPLKLGGAEVTIIIEDVRRMLVALQSSQCRTIRGAGVCVHRFNKLIGELERLLNMCAVSVQRLQHRLILRQRASRWQTTKRVKSIIGHLSHEEILDIKSKVHAFVVHHENAPTMMHYFEIGFLFNSVPCGGSLCMDVSWCALKNNMMTMEDYQKGIRFIEKGNKKNNHSFAVPLPHTFAYTKNVHIARKKVANRGKDEVLPTHFGRNIMIGKKLVKIGEKETEMQSIYIAEILAMFIIEKDALRRGKATTKTKTITTTSDEL